MRRQILAVICCAMTVGCADSGPREPSIHQRQDQVLKDPFNYSPHGAQNSVGGGGTMDFNKDAFRRDVQHVFDP